MPKRTKLAPCSNSACDYVGPLKRGMCPKDYQQWWKTHKDDLPPRTGITAVLGKVCTGCLKDKPLSRFAKEKRSKSGYTSRCMDCLNTYNRNWRKDNPDKNCIYLNNHRTRNPDARRKEYEISGWAYYLTRRYGITAVDYQTMLDAQDGGCAICGRTDSGEENRKMPLDHDHETEQNRDILCAPCNKGLGHFGDDPDRLLAAAAYLLRHRALANACEDGQTQDQQCL